MRASVEGELPRRQECHALRMRQPDMYGDHPSPPSHRSDERGAAARIILLLYGSLLWKRFRLGSSVTLHVFQDPFHSPKFFSLSRWVMRKMAMVRETVIADLIVGQ